MNDDMPKLLFHALRFKQMLVLIVGAGSKGFTVYPKEPPPTEFVALIHAHSDRLRALLDKPVVLAVHWDDDDDRALVQILPDELKDHTDEKFVEFELPFPDTVVIEE